MITEEEAIEIVKNNGSTLRNLDDELRDSYDVVVAAIKNDGFAYMYASKRLQFDREICLMAVTSEFSVKYEDSWSEGSEPDILYRSPYEYMDEKIRKDYEITLAALGTCGLAIKSAGVIDRELVKVAVNNCGFALEYVGDEYRKDEEIVKIAVNNASCAIRYAEYNDEIIRLAVKNDPHAIYYVKTIPDYDLVLDCAIRGVDILGLWHDKFSDDYRIVYNSVKCSGSSVEYASKRLKDNYKIGLAAVKNNGCAFQYLSKRLRNNYNLAKIAIEYSPALYEYIGNSLKTNSTLAMMLMMNVREPTMKFIPKKFTNNIGLVTAAIKVDPKVYNHISENLKSHFKVAMTMVTYHPWSLSLIKYFQDDYDIVMKAIEGGTSLRHVSDRLRNNNDIVMVATDNDPTEFRFASPRLRGTKSLLLKVIEHYSHAITLTDGSLLDDDDVVKLMIDKDPFNISKLGPKTRDNYDLVKSLFERGMESFPDGLSERLRDDRDLMTLALTKIGCESFKSFSERLRDDCDIVMMAIKLSRWRGYLYCHSRISIDHISKRLMKNRNVFLEIVKNGSWNCEGNEFSDDYEILYWRLRHAGAYNHIPSNLLKLPDIEKWLLSYLELRKGNGLVVYHNDHDLNFDYL